MKMTDQERGELRAKKSRRILDRLGGFLEGPVAKSLLPTSKLGGAFNTILNHWEASMCSSMVSLVASALRMDLEVGMYLEGVITHMLRGTAKTEELFPDRWTAAHPPGGARVPRARAS
jgi:hypothetical protein